MSDPGSLVKVACEMSTAMKNNPTATTK